jgi:hypothetical protein
LRRAKTPRILLAVLRSAGSGAFLAPGVAARALGLSRDTESEYLVRLFAARNIALTLGLLMSDDHGRRAWWRAGVVCDVLDALAGVLAARAGKSSSGAAVDICASLTAAGIGVAGLRTEPVGERPSNERAGSVC